MTTYTTLVHPFLITSEATVIADNEHNLPDDYAHRFRASGCRSFPPCAWTLPSSGDTPPTAVHSSRSCPTVSSSAPHTPSTPLQPQHATNSLKIVSNAVYDIQELLSTWLPTQWLYAPDCENLYSPCKHGRTINSTNQDTNQIKSKQKKTVTSGQKTLEAQFKFRHTFGP